MARSLLGLKQTYIKIEIARKRDAFSHPRRAGDYQRTVVDGSWPLCHAPGRPLRPAAPLAHPGGGAAGGGAGGGGAGGGGAGGGGAGGGGPPGQRGVAARTAARPRRRRRVQREGAVRAVGAEGGGAVEDREAVGRLVVVGRHVRRLVLQTGTNSQGRSFYYRAYTHKLYARLCAYVFLVN